MARPRSSTKIRTLVVKRLRGHKVAEPPVPVEEIARGEGAEIRYVPYEGELSGMLFRDNDRSVIGVNSRHHVNRQRFTIAHELAHLIMHRGEEVFVDRIYRINRRDEVSSQAVNKEEIEANRFAAELLMPLAFLEADLSGQEIDIEDEQAIRQLAIRYRVSVAAMAFRLSNVFSLR